VTRLDRANVFAFALPAALLAGAWGSQLIGHLYPCEMCHWQRWPHYAALGIALLAFLIKPMRSPLVVLAAFAILISGGIGVWHAGVEYHWWQGITTCSRIGGGTLADIMAAPLIRCDTAQWTLFGISLAGFNAIISIAGGLLILNLLRKPR
jgi:disulfide bond formation protein DsbB